MCAHKEQSTHLDECPIYSLWPWFHFHLDKSEWNFSLWQASLHDTCSFFWEWHEDRFRYNLSVSCTIRYKSQNYTVECNKICIHCCWSIRGRISKRAFFVGRDSFRSVLRAHTIELAFFRLSRLSRYIISGFQCKMCEKRTEFQHFCWWD